MSNTGEFVICQNCGTRNDEGAFCVNCGAALPISMNQTPAYQPTYAAPPSTPLYKPEPPVVQQTVIAPITSIKGFNSKWDYTPIKPWGYFGFNLLFGLPVIGLIFLLIFALGGTKKINLRNYARSFFCGLVLVAVIIILLLIFWSTIMNLLGVPFIPFGDIFKFEFNIH